MELQVVISIISFLSSVVMTSVTGARARARDTQRITDLRQIQTALELYFQDNGTYPICDATFPNGECTSNGDYGDIRNLFGNPINTKYISSVSVDPLNKRTSYGYYYARGYKKSGLGYLGNSVPWHYILGAMLEKSRNVPNYYGWKTSNLNYLLGTE